MSTQDIKVMSIKKSRPPISSGDYDRVILDMLDDIVLAERRAKTLIDRIDALHNKPSLRMIDIELYLWVSGIITVTAFLMGAFMGFFIYYWIKGI